MFSGAWKRLSSKGDKLSIIVYHLVPHCSGPFDHARWLALRSYLWSDRLGSSVGFGSGPLGRVRADAPTLPLVNVMSSPAS
jgi:hypothetical protein